MRRFGNTTSQSLHTASPMPAADALTDGSEVATCVAAEEHHPPSRSKYLTLTAMMFAVAMTFIDQTIVAIASPTIQSKLALTETGSQWVVNAYLLALAATFAFGGRLADVLGHRRMVIIGVVGFAASSALCGATPTGGGAQAWIVIFRALQGVFGALMLPAAVAIVVESFPFNERGRAMAVFFTVSGGMTAIGPIAGGFLTQWTWRAIFWINVPVAVIALILTAFAGIAPTRRPGRIDVRGAILVAAGMALSVLGLQQAQTWGWGSPLTWLCIIGGLAILAVFVRLQLRTEIPLLQLRIFRSWPFVVDNAVLFLSMIAFVPVFFFASLYSQIALHDSANESGLYLLLIFAGFAPAAQIGGRLLDKRGARRPMVVGSALACVGFALWASKIETLSLHHQWPFIVMAGAGMGLIVGPASTDAVNRAIDASYGEVTGITQTVRNYGSSLGLAVLGTLLTTTFVRHLTTTFEGLGIPAHQASTAAHHAANSRSAASASGVSAQVQHAIALDFASATRVVLIGMAIALGASFFAAMRYPRTTRSLGEQAVPVVGQVAPRGT
jgi:EmrB/QacA subfamily drug resistance transporter